MTVPGVSGARGHEMRRLAGRDAAARHHGLAIAQIEAERHVVAAHGGADPGERGVGGQRLEPDDGARCAEGERVLRTVGRRDAGIQPERHADGRHSGNERVLRRAAHDRVEVGGVQLGEPEAPDVGARERERVAGSDGRAGDRPHRLVGFALSRAGVNRTLREQVDDADDSHVSVTPWRRTVQATPKPNRL